jgi:phage baseplate assembly protein W
MAIYTDFSITSGDLNNIAEITDENAINNALKNIFLTPLGSLHGKPRFGTRLFEVIFSFIDYATELTIKEIIKEEVVKFEPRITLKSIDIKSIPEYNKISVIITYVFFAKSLETTGTAKISLIN